MKNYVYIILLFCSVSSAQYFVSSDKGYYEIRVLETKNFDNFYFSEYEFNPAENAKTLAEIEKTAKENQYPVVRYDISKSSNKSAQVTVYVNNQLFSFSKFSNGLLEGKKIIYHGNGNPFYEMEYVKGKANGSAKIYDEKNRVAFETEYKNNVKEGKRIFYINKRDLISIEANYKNDNVFGDLILTKENGDVYHYPNDLKNGKVKGFYQNKLIEEYNLVAGELHGAAIIYYNGNDKMYAKIPYTFGLKNGIAEYYNRNGELLTKCEFKFGKKIGKHEKYSLDNELENVEYYDENGNKTGTWIKYNYDKKYIETTYNTDGSYKTKTYDNNENIKSISNYNSSHSNSGLTQNFNNGLLETEIFKVENTTKWSKMFYENGKVFSTETKKGENYERAFFDKDGNTIHINQVNDSGKRIGIHKNGYLKNDSISFYDETHYNENGKKIKWIYFTPKGKNEYQYRNEQPHGKRTEYDQEGKIISETYHYETNGTSRIVSKEEFEKLIKSEKK
jgi:antitoxin component YwqK of YwqJK toxin-antitoxin module